MKTTVTIHDKGKEWSGLMKVPDEIVIKQLRKDLGAANAYIEELEDRIKLMECEQKIIAYKKQIGEMLSKLCEYKTKLKWYRKIYGQIPADNIEIDE